MDGRSLDSCCILIRVIVLRAPDPAICLSPGACTAWSPQKPRPLALRPWVLTCFQDPKILNLWALFWGLGFRV